MNKQITNELIIKFNKKYNFNPNNKILENAITQNGLEKACMDNSIIIENQPIFNIELPEGKMYNQKDNYRCWIYAGLNFIKYNIAQNLNIDLENFTLSNNYIAFFDKLEKSNNTYENIINLKNTNWDYINKNQILDYGVREEGCWQWFMSIVNKYGLMPYDYMPDAFESLNFEKITTLFDDKVKKDCIKLINAKKQEKSVVELRRMKEEFLKENYDFLSKVLGQPLSKFDYEYKDKNSKYTKYENLTPMEFKNKFLTIDLNDFISLSNLKMYNKDFYKLYRKPIWGNIYEKSHIEFLNLPIEEIKELSIKQLKDNMPVYIGINIMKYRDIKSGVLDTRLYNYKKTFGFDLLNKEEALNTNDIHSHHCMTICGVNLLEDGKPQRWKIEDSYGDEKKFNGYYIMNDNYFDEFLLQAIINKKYLSQKQLEALNQEYIDFELTDPF